MPTVRTGISARTCPREVRPGMKNAEPAQHALPELPAREPPKVGVWHAVDAPDRGSDVAVEERRAG